MYLQRTLREVVLPEDLGDTTIVVLGLVQMGYTDPKVIAGLLTRVRPRSVRKLLRQLKESRNPTVRECVDKGLPPGLCRPLPYEGAKVRCPICRLMVDHAPCPYCNFPRNRRWLEAEAMPDAKPGRPTNARPGSRKKLDVMRSRAEQGLAVFHPQDR